MNMEMITLLYHLHAAVGTALSVEQQVFVTKEYPNLAKFLETDAGKVALREFIRHWQETVSGVKTTPVLNELSGRSTN